MGFFSSIIDFVKSIVQDVVQFVANIFGGGPTGVFLATLAVVVVAFVALGPEAFSLLMDNPWVFLTEHPILAAFVVNTFIQAVSLISPDIGRAVGYVLGVVSFLMTGLQIAEWVLGTEFSVLRMLQAVLPAGLGLTAAQLEALYTLTKDTILITTVTGLLAGPSAAYVTGFIDGFFAIPQVVAEVADIALAAVGSSALGLILLAGAAFMMLKGGSTTRVNLVAEGSHGRIA